MKRESLCLFIVGQSSDKVLRTVVIDYFHRDDSEFPVDFRRSDKPEAGVSPALDVAGKLAEDVLSWH